MFRFFREYILQGGILDGKAGIQTAWIAAFYSFNKQARLWTLNHGEQQADAEPERERPIVADQDRYHDRAAYR